LSGGWNGSTRLSAYQASAQTLKTGLKRDWSDATSLQSSSFNYTPNFDMFNICAYTPYRD